MEAFIKEHLAIIISLVVFAVFHIFSFIKKFQNSIIISPSSVKPTNQKKKNMNKAWTNSQEELATFLSNIKSQKEKQEIAEEVIEEFIEDVEQVEKKVVQSKETEVKVKRTTSTPRVNINFLKENAQSAIILKEILATPKGLL